MIMDYKIKEFPRIIDRPPEDPYKFTCNDIRILAIERGLDHNNTVQYITRRKIVENLTFEKEATIKMKIILIKCLWKFLLEMQDLRI